MRFRNALLGAMRTWRTHRIGLHEADRLVAGGRTGPGSPGLEHLLDAARAPATAGETRGEQAMAIALAAERRRAVLTARPKGDIRVQMPTSARTIVVSITAAVALLSVGGTAVAAKTGNLPDGVQQHAHDLFSALGVPAPGTGPTVSPPGPTASAAPSTAVTRPTPAPIPKPRPHRTPTPTPTVTAAAEVRAWCEAWRVASGGGHPMNGRARRDLTAAAGGEENIAQYCTDQIGSASPGATATATKPGKGHKPHPGKPSHPGSNK